MPNLMQYLRMANIFNPQMGNDMPSQGGITGTMPRPDIFGNIRFDTPEPVNPTQMGTTTVASPADYDAGSRMAELYQPQNEASNRYNELIGGYPERQDYKPSMMRRIGAALISAGQSFGPRGFQPNSQALESGMEFMNRPYNEQLGDWKNQIGPAQQAATLERNQNVNDRTLAYQTVSQELSQRKTDATTKIAADKAEVYRLKQLRPNFKFDFSGPTVTMADPATGQITPTNIPTGSLSDADKLALQQSNAIEQIGARTQGQIDVEGVRQQGRETLSEDKGWTAVNIPDPSDPTKTIAVRMHLGSGRVEPITLGGQTVPGITKPGTKPPGADSNLQAIQNKTQETLDSLNEILDDKGHLRPEMRSAIGASRMFGLQHLPATQTRAGDAAIKRLKSMLIVDLVGEMKAQSRTGATGFGQLNLRELAVLENAASKLDPSLDEATFEAELNRIKEKLQKVLQPGDGLTPTQTPAGAGRTLTADELIQKYGGR